MRGRGRRGLYDTHELEARGRCVLPAHFALPTNQRVAPDPNLRSNVGSRHAFRASIEKILDRAPSERLRIRPPTPTTPHKSCPKQVRTLSMRHDDLLAGPIVGHFTGERKTGWGEVLHNIAELTAPLKLDHYAGAILAASVHMKRHEREFVNYVKAHRAELESLPTAFLSVCMREAGAEDPAASPAQRAQATADVQQTIEHSSRRRAGTRRASNRSRAPCSTRNTACSSDSS